MKTNFSACTEIFHNRTNTSIAAQYNYTGTVHGIFEHLPQNMARPGLYTLEGCLHVCGNGTDYYPWSRSSNTISTWVLPVLGLLLQAPYESNAFLDTVFATARWVGSPIASLSYILWNIKVTGKCALLVDMATPYEDIPEEEYSQFAQMRDSFYILSVMNQYSIMPNMPAVEAEKLLRVALFSDSLQLEMIEDESHSLVKRRRKLAKTIREGRRRGAVPVFISLLWFLYSLAVSIQASFDQAGDNATAHNLAIGLLLAWLPVLILSSIVDRNPVASDSSRLKLNRLIDAVRRALLNPGLRETYIRETGRAPEEFAWTLQLSNEDYFHEHFFEKFAGQGCIRWHYGVAHPILASIEDGYVTECGRGWLHNADEARTAFVKGPFSVSGLQWFDFREAWQILSSILVVGGSVGGAFTLSYWTPTVGLGCRSGGYLIYVVIALGLFLVEMICWILISRGSLSVGDHITRFGTSIQRRLSRSPSNWWTVMARHWSYRLISGWTSLSTRDKIEYLLIRPCEMFNSVWLCYIVFAQTFGSYQNCRCMASTWSLHSGGYVDFEDENSYRKYGIIKYWSIGTGLSMFVMMVSFAFIIMEWCTQSHLSTEDYQGAARGLRRTRRFKKYTSYIRDIGGHIVKLAKYLWYRGARGDSRSYQKTRRSLTWTSKCKQQKTRSGRLPIIIDGQESDHGITHDEEQEVLLERGKDKVDSSYLLQTISAAHPRSPRSSFTEDPPDPSMRSPFQHRDFC